MRIRGGRAWAIAVCGPALASIGGCVNARMTPTQMDALQVRVVEAPPERAYAAATSALLDAGYLIHVSDGDAGLLTAEKRVDTPIATNVAVIVLSTVLTLGHAPVDVPPSYHAVSIQVLPGTAGRSSVRVRPFLNGLPAPCDTATAEGRTTIDELWALMQRQVLMKEPARAGDVGPG